MNLFIKLFTKIQSKIYFQLELLETRRNSKHLIVPFSKTLFRNKRVAIIGGADSAFKAKNGGYIDGFDVVVRINKGVELIDDHSSFVGKRTDVLFHCLYEDVNYGGSPVTLNLWKTHNVKILLFSMNKGISRYSLSNFLNFLSIFRGEISFSEVPLSLSKLIFSLVKPFSPTTGFLAINTVLSCAPAELYITGITFFRTSHHRDYRTEPLEYFTNMMSTHNSHSPDIEFNIIKDLYMKNQKIIQPDETLLKLINESEAQS